MDEKILKCKRIKRGLREVLELESDRSDFVKNGPKVVEYGLFYFVI